MKLNIGCGADAWGDVRIDAVKDYWFAKGKCAANMLADAQYLPFRDKSFEEARMHHVLEHIPNWKKALVECCRVAGKMSIVVPVYSYIPRLEWNNIIPFPNLLFSLTYLRYLSEVPRRTREHIWQFNVKRLALELKMLGFHHIKINTSHAPLFSFFVYGRKGKYFGKHLDRPKILREWKIEASE